MTHVLLDPQKVFEDALRSAIDRTQKDPNLHVTIGFRYHIHKGRVEYLKNKLDWQEANENQQS